MQRIEPLLGWGMAGLALLAAPALAAPQASMEPRSLVENGTFSEWRGELPVGWSAGVGAAQGEGPQSEIVPLEAGAGVALVGDGRTRGWLLLAQGFPVEAGRVYRLAARARLRASRREPGQFDSRYVGLAFQDGAGQRLDLRLRDVTEERWTEDELYARAPEGAVRAEAWVFLSRTGRLEVSEVAVEPVGEGASFDVLARQLDRYYSHFALKGIDWGALVERYRGRLAEEQDVTAFVEGLSEMLAELRDEHVWIDPPQRRRVVPYSTRPLANYDYRAVGRQLEGLRQIGRTGFVGRTPEGFGYVAVGTFQGAGAEYERLLAAAAELFDAPGFLVDVRANTGGDEARAQALAGRFADRERVYAQAQLRSGTGHEDFGEVIPRSLSPTVPEPFTRPVVCLVGRHTFSSGEEFALMMDALPHVTLVGQPTRGSVGNPQPIDLPNGVRVWASSWLDQDPDGTPIEDRGVEPSVLVEHEGSGDPTFAAAVRALAERVEAAR